MTDCSRKAVTVCPSVSTIITINNFRSCATCQRTISSSKLIVDWNNQSASMITILNLNAMSRSSQIVPRLFSLDHARNNLVRMPRFSIIV